MEPLEIFEYYFFRDRHLMPKFPRFTAKDLIKALQRRGFVLVRQSGSHKIYRNADGIRATVPFHASKIIHPKIVKQICDDLDILPFDL